jgi:small subunit ribosomal protein S6
MAFLRSQRDVPGTQREYETIYILRPDAATEQIHDVNTRIRKIIEESGGSLIRVDNWGKRKLAYEINKQLKGIYLYWLYLGGAELVAEIERNLRMLDLVIRYYTVKIDETVDPAARPSQMDDESFAATATTVPDEEDAYLGRVQDDAPAPAETPAAETPAAETPAAETPAAETPAAATDEAQAAAAAPAEATEPTEQPAPPAEAATEPAEPAAEPEEQPAAPEPQEASDTPAETTEEKKED